MAGKSEATPEQLAEAASLHKRWSRASARLERAEADLKDAQDKAADARSTEDAASVAYSEFHKAFWATRGEP